ncbi:hypothetical protein RMN56_20710 [Micromonospora halotolerans]|uniref:RHIM domain-containing protein n=1 Tax=Micromonospora halotolerans TaxID=709879 RepID=A0ABY9ZQM8_9ACTN|nr:hypothetical protein [Micromonospora halotolerans]WNM37578.1 hypothetical protein RMN56_20710 [Micromonospora halotolerans]
MSDVELVVAALAAGASAGVTATASTAVQDAYAGLKKLLRPWVRGEARAALNADEREPLVLQAQLGEELQVSGAAEDDEVVAAAQRLLLLADPELAARYGVAGSSISVVAGDQSRVFTGPADARAMGDGLAVGQVGGDVTVGRDGERRGPSGPGR